MSSTYVYWIDLNDEQRKIYELLRKADRPLTLDEIVSKIGLERKAVVENMLPLVKCGLIKNFIREEQGKILAVYIAL